MQNPPRHAGPVPASTFPRTGKRLISRHSGPRNKSGVTEGSGGSADFFKGPAKAKPHVVANPRFFYAAEPWSRIGSGMTDDHLAKVQVRPIRAIIPNTRSPAGALNDPTRRGVQPASSGAISQARAAAISVNDRVSRAGLIRRA